MEIWAIQAGVAQEAMRQVGAEYHDIAAIGITNQRETTVVWEKIREGRSITPSFGSAGGQRNTVMN